MGIPETQKDLLVYLDSMTRQTDGTRLDRFTTAAIAQAISVSRNLASQYLNELVRAGLVVKAGSRPVHYFHRRALERVLQSSLDESVYASPKELLSGLRRSSQHDFSKAVGHGFSLSPCIDQLRAAMKYPPRGLPVLLIGAAGTGKSLLARLAFEYGRNHAILGQDAQFVSVDCSRYQHSPDAFSADCLGRDNIAGALKTCEGGVLLLKDFDLLSPSSQELALSWATSDDAASREGTPPIRLMLSTSVDPTCAAIRELARRVPMVVTVPPLRERSAEEREELVLHFLKAEGRRMGVDILISRGAFRCLANADLEGNVRELRRCITNCCAEAYLHHTEDTLEIRAYQLPPEVLGEGLAAMEGGDDQLLDTTRCVEALDGDSAIGMLDHILETGAISEGKSVPDKDLAEEIAKRVQAYEDHLVFGNGTSATRSEALERVASTLVDDLNKLYATDLTRKSARLIARELCAQLWPSASLSRWRARHAAELEGLLSRLSGEWRFARAATEHLVSELSRTLGTELDPLTRLLVTAHVAGASAQTERRRSIGIVISHGYSTATSIADAANRILHARVFEAIDMPYDQQIKDVVGPLQQLVDRFSYCEEIAILVDMGSLEDIHEDLSSISSITLGIINNASTGLAVEVGAGMVAGRSLREVLAEAAGSCVCRYRVVERKARQDALVFCSEGGSAAAEKIRALVVQSLGSDASVRTIACGLRRLASNGEADAVFGAYNVRAIIGTTDPKIPGITFIALEDLISGEEAAHIDPVFSQFLDAGSLADFHRNLVKNMTLRNVVESITILNPNRLFGEIEQAVRTLERHTGDRVPDGATIGLYVHLCCLVERLVTRNAIETYTDEGAFLASHLDFVNAFRASFSDIATRYHVEVPVAEIAYVFDYINSWHAPRKRALPTTELEEETDE